MADVTTPALKLTMRNMQTEDLDRVLEIEHESQPFPWSRKQFHREIAHIDVSRPLVAELEDHRIAGFVVAWYAPGEAQVLNLGVEVARRGRGIGTALIRRVFETARREACRSVFLEVRASNTAARQLYEKLHFSNIARRKGYYQDRGEDAIVMQRDLS